VLGDPPPDSRKSPTADTPAAVNANGPIRSRRNTAASSGVMTTNRPVMNPAFDAVVCSSPSVCST
jgi:hypothetical protein